MNPNDAANKSGPILSQSDVERMLSEAQTQETTTLVVKSMGAKGHYKSEEIQPCDFRQPAFLTPSELRKIRLRHQEFVRSLAARLSIYLRLEVSIQMSKLQTMSFQAFIDSLCNPTHLTLFKAEPLRGVCLLDVTPRLGLTIVNRLLGGPAHSITWTGDLSEIEIALLDQTIQILLGEWCNLWVKLQDLRPVLLGHENNGRFVHTVPQDTIMLVLSLEVHMGDCTEPVQLALPYFTVEPLIRQMGDIGANDKEVKPPDVVSSKWNPELNDVNIQITAEWPGLELTAHELAVLKRGDVLLLEPQCVNEVQIRLERISKYLGRLGTRDKKWAVEIVNVIKS